MVRFAIKPILAGLTFGCVFLSATQLPAQEKAPKKAPAKVGKTAPPKTGPKTKPSDDKSEKSMKDKSVAGKLKGAFDWKILGTGSEVMAGTKYTLRNITNNQSVKYDERRWGINLVWDKSTAINNITFVRKDGKKVALKYGDTVAVHVQKGGHLKHKERTVGINLAWSTPPVYEFVLVGGKKGSPIKVGASVGLFNSDAKDFIIYAERPAGINLRWFKDKDLAGGVWDRLRKEAGDLLKEHGMDLLKAAFLVVV
jgi:hypothetical protein